MIVPDSKNTVNLSQIPISYYLISNNLSKYIVPAQHTHRTDHGTDFVKSKPVMKFNEK